MLLNQIGEVKAAQAVDNSVIKVVREKLNSLGAGRMGYSTSEVGDLVVKEIINN
jgi:3-isopropylmalate dehydrogenase